MPQNFLQTTWKTEYEKSAIFELCTDDNKSKCSSNPKDIFKSAKKNMKLCTKWTSTAATTEFVCKIPIRKKISNEHFNLCEAEISWNHKIYKFWNK